MADAQAKVLGTILFPGFELLDVFGPLEMFGNLTGVVDVKIVAQEKAPVASAQGPKVVADYGFEKMEAYQVVSQVGVVRVANMVDPNYTVMAKFPKRLLPARRER